MTFLKLWGGRKSLSKTITSNIMKGTSYERKMKQSIRRSIINTHIKWVINVSKRTINNF